MRCFVPGCTNNQKYQPELSFHKFPQNEERRNQWLKILQLEGARITEKKRICATHFPDNCFRDSRESRRLNLSAVPSLHLGLNLNETNGISINYDDQSIASYGMRSKEESMVPRRFGSISNCKIDDSINHAGNNQYFRDSRDSSKPFNISVIPTIQLQHRQISATNGHATNVRNVANRFIGSHEYDNGENNDDDSVSIETIQDSSDDDIDNTETEGNDNGTQQLPEADNANFDANVYFCISSLLDEGVASTNVTPNEHPNETRNVVKREVKKEIITHDEQNRSPGEFLAKSNESYLNKVKPNQYVLKTSSSQIQLKVERDTFLKKLNLQNHQITSLQMKLLQMEKIEDNLRNELQTLRTNGSNMKLLQFDLDEIKVKFRSKQKKIALLNQTVNRKIKEIETLKEIVRDFKNSNNCVSVTKLKSEFNVFN